MSVLSIDFETRATVNLRKTGLYPYAEHKNTDIWCMAWAFDEEEPQIWWPHHVQRFLQPDRLLVEDLDDRILAHIHQGGEIRAWNSDFERIIWKRIMHERYGFPDLTLEQIVDTAAEAAAMALPRPLDQACLVTRVPFQKDKEGYSLMMRMTKPRSKKGKPLEWWYDKTRLVRLGEYCKQDVRAERAMVKVTRRLTPLEREHYLEVCQQNDRGITVDLPLVRAMRRVADEGIDRANATLEELTEGEVSEVTNHQRLRAWVNSKGVETDSVDKKTVRELMSSDIDPDVKAALQLRTDAGRSSLAKLDSLLECTARDGKVHGLLVYHGASTGRETAKLFQPHNLPRGEVPDPPGYKGDPWVETYIPAMLREEYDVLDLFHHPITIASALIRSTLTASEGNELIAADFSGIEARVVCWLAGQQDALDLFAAGEDVYKHFAAKMWKIPISAVTKHQRQGGKFAVLGCGFQMGAETGRTQAKDQYGLELTLEETQAIITQYRTDFGKVKAWWRTLNDAAIAAVETPGSVRQAGEYIRFTKRGAYLYMILPAGRPLVYAQPKIVERVAPWSTPEKPRTVTAVQIMAVHPKSKQWWRQDMYGGIWAENATQAVARDVMSEGKLRVRDAGYPSVLSVHDEVVSEVPLGFGSLKEFGTLLTQNPAWATGLPIACESWRGHRYRK